MALIGQPKREKYFMAVLPFSLAKAECIKA